MLSSCGTYTGSGAASGAYFGSTFGSALGALTGGHRGYHVGQLVGMTTGAVVGAAVGSEADRRVSERSSNIRRSIQKSQDNTYTQQQGGYTQPNGSYYQPDNTRQYPSDAQSGYSQNGGYDDRIDFGGGSVAQPAPQHGISTMNMGELEIRNVRFVDRNHDGFLSAGETAELVFELRNNTGRTLYGVTPTVMTANRNSHIRVSPSVRVKSIPAGRAVRYTAYVSATRSLRNGRVEFVVSADDNGRRISNIVQIPVRTIRR